GITDADVLLHALPIFHIHGLFVAMHTLMIAGGKILFHRHFDPDQVINDLPNATVIMGVPTFYSRLLENKRFNSETAKDMRLFVSGSAPLTAEASNAFHEATGHRILERYGMSEAGMITSNPLDDTAGRIPGTVGYPLPDVQIRTAGEDDTGEVEIKGPNVFKGYWRNTEKTAEAFTKDGWFRTGDIGTLSEDGRLSLVGRAKDLIIVGGLNVYPKEIESVLDANPAITESAVVGAPHPDMGEGVVAFLVPQSDSTSANHPSKEQLEEIVAPLAKFKRPRHFVWIDALPRNAMGKVQKQLLRERCKETFGRG
ncbi:MAG: AMP-binding protein, partial [Pseudomonadota bacterium]